MITIMVTMTMATIRIEGLPTVSHAILSNFPIVRLDNINTLHLNSVLDAKLIASYRETEYTIFVESQIIVVRIDHYSPSIEPLLSASSTSCAAIVSADNPYSQLQSADENVLANELFRDFLIQNNHRFFESLNIDPTETWLPEKSFLVLGLDLNAAENIGRQFKQNGIVWIDQSAIARLMLLR